jgi:snRNA-activating protein complex (SNAPc), subunit 3
MLTITVLPLTNVSGRHPVAARHQRLHVLASSTLAQFRDALACPADYMPSRDVTTGAYTDEALPTGSVLAIEERLYGDERVQPDYAEQIAAQIEQVVWPAWAAAKRKGTGGSMAVDSSSESGGGGIGDRFGGISPPEYVVADKGMGQTRWDELPQVRLGVAYWFRHAGNCEHIFTIDDVRLVHPDDPQPGASGARYPATTFLSRVPIPKCRVCDRDPVTVLTLDDELGGEAPCLMCDACFGYIHGSWAAAVAAGVRVVPMLQER